MINNNDYLCQCDLCGQIKHKTAKALKVAKSRYLSTGIKTSCGCRKYAGFQQKHDEKKDLTGQRFENLLVIEQGPTIEVGSSKKKRRTWKCKCDCGAITYVTTGDLTSNNTKSCGCLLSVGEKRISEELTKRNVGFIREFSFSDLL